MIKLLLVYNNANLKADSVAILKLLLNNCGW